MGLLAAGEPSVLDPERQAAGSGHAPAPNPFIPRLQRQQAAALVTGARALPAGVSERLRSRPTKSVIYARPTRTR
jgi:hypothetical protein